MDLMATGEDMKNPKIRDLLIPLYIPSSDMAEMMSKYKIILPNTFCCFCGDITEDKSITCRSCHKNCYGSKIKHPILIMMRLGDYSKNFTETKPLHIEQNYCHYCGTLRRVGQVNERDPDHPLLHLTSSFVK